MGKAPNGVTVILDLPSPPPLSALYRNARGPGRVKTRRYEDWQLEAGWELVAQLDPPDDPDRIVGHYVLTIAMQRPDKRRRDLDNCIKALSDLLVKHGVIEDDSFATEIILRWEGEGTRCRVEVAPATEAGAA